MRLKLFIEDQHGQKASLSVHAWNLIKDIKDAIQAQLHFPATRQRLFFSNRELRNTRSLCDSNISDGSKLFLELAPVAPMNKTIIRHYGNTPCPGTLKKIVRSSRMGLIQGLAPRLAMDGTGGTYFLRNPRRQTVAVFKPADEEPFAPSNPRNYVGKMGQVGFRKGILSGEGYLREVAAFLLDNQTGFSGVPMTTIAEMQDPAFHFSGKGMGRASDGGTKIGSLQEYVRYDDTAGDLAAKMFPANEIHKIAILDIRIANTDRNEANILVRRPDLHSGDKDMHLIPIDHAYSLPDTLEIAWTDWVWLEWPQAKVPFDEKTREFVRNLDIDRDIELLRSNLGIREACLRTMKITCTVLKKGVAAGLTLRQIAGIICRNDLDVPSELEAMCTQAYKMAQTAQEQHRIKVPKKLSDKEFNRRFRRKSAAAPPGLSRSISYNDFKHLKVGHDGFEVSQIRDLDSEIIQRRLDETTHTWHLEVGRKNQFRRLRSKPLSKLFFDYLGKLLDQHVEICARQMPRSPYAASPSGCSSASPIDSPSFCSLNSPSGSKPRSSWLVVQDSSSFYYKRREQGKNNNDNDDDKDNDHDRDQHDHDHDDDYDDKETSLSFKKTQVVKLQKRRTSMISTALKQTSSHISSSNRTSPEAVSKLRSARSPTSKASDPLSFTHEMHSGWDSHIPTFGAAFSPVAEVPQAKSSDSSDWSSRSELETEDHDHQNRTDGTHDAHDQTRHWRASETKFNSQAKISGFAPPLGRSSLNDRYRDQHHSVSTSIPMSMPRGIGAGMMKNNGGIPIASREDSERRVALAKQRQRQILSKSAPRKVPAWKPSWKIRREKQQINSQGNSVRSIGNRPPLSPLGKMEAAVNPIDTTCIGSSQPRRVVGGFSSNSSTSKPVPTFASAGAPYRNTGFVFDDELEF
mmetsp:Transcript_16768/g.30085  ORF Transcript_16768/g.30085 Transcript_16768/m.30085 type:complete len:913 (+) Transcript_16768:142-2880(+)